MVVVIICTLVLLGFITMAVRWLEAQQAERFEVLVQHFVLLNQTTSATHGALPRLRTDITDLWGLFAEGHASVRSEVAHRAEETSSSLEEFSRLRHQQLFERLDRLQEGAAEAGETLRGTLERQLGEIMREVSDPAVVILLRALADAFQIPLPLPAAPMESPATPTVVGPLAPHPVPNIGRQLEVARFSEESITAGMQDLMDGAAARGVTLQHSDARHQVMLMLNGVDIE